MENFNKIFSSITEDISFSNPSYWEYHRNIWQTVFVNNPFLGPVFLLAISISNPTAGLGCAVGGFISTGTDFLLGLHPTTLLESGVSSFNGSLIGTVLCALFPLVNASQLELWTGVCFGSLIR